MNSGDKEVFNSFSRYALRHPMKLVDAYSGEMECKICGSHHWASIKDGHYVRGSYRCSYEGCLSNQRAWSEVQQRDVLIGWLEAEGVAA